MIRARCRLAAAWLLVGLAAAALAEEEAARTITRAESMLFETDHLGGLALPAQLDYRYSRDGEAPVEDRIVLTVSRERRVEPDYLTGERHANFPPIDNAQGNPVLLYFLERDLREMQQETGGRADYFRRLIRRALADPGVAVQAIEVSFGGRKLPASRVVIEPYRNDPMAPVRYPTLIAKRYEFVLAAEAPGQVVSMASAVPLAGGRTVTERVELIGATPGREP